MTTVDATPVHIFDQFARVPAYHLPAWLVNGEGYRANGNGNEEYLVACGRAYGEWTAGDRPHNVDHTIVLRRDHAELFGRLCRNCAWQEANPHED